MDKNGFLSMVLRRIICDLPNSTVLFHSLYSNDEVSEYCKANYPGIDVLDDGRLDMVEQLQTDLLAYVTTSRLLKKKK
jgi:hypothetical protein